MISDVKYNVDQIAPSVLSEGQNYPAMTKLGQLFTADWIQRLALAGRVFSLDLGTAETALAGNAGMDADQPEFLISAGSGWLIPVALNLSVNGVIDADDEKIEVLVVGDRTNETTSVTGTTETPLNLLDGGDDFGGYAFSIMTANITITEADILYAKNLCAVQVGADGTYDAAVNVDHVWSVPILLAGNCQIAGYVCGSATATAFYGRVTFAHLPSSWVVTS